MVALTGSLLAGFIIAAGTIAGCSSGTSPSATYQPGDSRQAWRLIAIDVDEDANGTTDSRFTLRYDVAGLEVGEGIDENADGTDEHTFEFIYADSRLVQSNYDRGNDGSIETIRRFEYRSDGSLQYQLIDRDSDGLVNGRAEYLLDGAGRFAQVQLDSDGDGDVDEVSAYTFDQPRLLRMDTDTDGDAVTDVRLDFTYDDMGRTVRRDRDDGSDGTVDSIWRYSYELALCDPASNHLPGQNNCVPVR